MKKEQYKSYSPGYHLMGDLNNDSKIGTWPVYYGDTPLTNGQFQDPHFQKTVADAYFGYHTETVRQKMLEHEAIFKTQLYELHRLYRVQRELMDDLKMNELQKQSMAIETSMSSCSASQRPDAQRWLTSLPFPLSSSSSAQPAFLGAKDFHSAPDFLNGRHPQNGLVSPSNPGSSKNCEVEILECRPSVARKFDLELQADEYIDVEEPKYGLDKLPGVSHCLSNGSCEVPPSSVTKMFLSQSNMIDSLGDEARQNNGENGLTDLNEQTQTQRLNSSSLNFVGCNSNFRSNEQSCSKSQLQTAPWDYIPNSHFGCNASGSRNLTMAHRDNGREWSHLLDSARSKGQTTFFSQNLLPENMDFFNKARNASYFQTNQIKADHWKERSTSGPKHSGNNFFNCLSNPHSEKSFTTSNALWEKSGGCMTQKSVIAETYPFFNSTSTLRQSLQSSSKSAQALGESWHNNSDSGVNTPYQNGLYKGSCSGSGLACHPTVGYNYLSRSNDTYVTSGASVCQNGLVKLEGLASADAISAKGIDLNMISVAHKHDYDDRPHQDHFAHLPWLKSSTGNGTIQSSNGCIMRQKTDMAPKPSTAKRIMGVPIFGDNHLSKEYLSGGTSLSKEGEMEKNGSVRDFDMNLPCQYEEKDTGIPVVSRRNLIDLNMCLADDDDAVMEIPTPGRHPEKTIRGFDLEASGDMEEEDMIQLKQQKSENSDEGHVAMAAAEVILGISSCRKLTFIKTPARNPSEATPQDTLKWFVDIISLCTTDTEGVLLDKSEEETDSVDYFECMTLQLAETKENEYLPEYPKPPEVEEETGPGLYTTRTRKGQARRGRPRRDFQRDILPGLSSLGRHEVTEDLQTFGGLMRATGHFWQSSLSRQAGPRRGRPRLTPVQAPSPFSTPNLFSLSCSPLPPKKPPSPCFSPSPKKRKTSTPKEVVNMEEDHGNLTGWGKTTRRPRRQPRRQRCSTASVALHIT